MRRCSFSCSDLHYFRLVVPKDENSIIGDNGAAVMMSDDAIAQSAGGTGRFRTQVFSTDQVAPHEREAYWKEAVFDAIANVDIACREPEAFSGRLGWLCMDLGDAPLTLSEVAATPQVARRGARQIAREREPFIALVVQRKGTAVIDQAGRTELFGPGEICLIDGTDRYKLAFEEPFEHLVLRIPYERLAPMLPSGGQWRGRILHESSPLGGVLKAHISAVAAALDRIDPASRSPLLDSAVDLIALAFTDELRDFAGDATTVRRALVLRAMQLIDKRLPDPRLSAHSLAGALGVSAGYLQHAFQSARTTVGGYIRQRRLERCRDDFADPLRVGEQIREIAMRWGFSDMPHFSRAFRQAFGLSPRQLRATKTEDRRRGR